ncbi:hypothetical protein [Vibrio phage PG216]|nr:hypothetical protein [Vibrio phage PG216]
MSAILLMKIGISLMIFGIALLVLGNITIWYLKRREKTMNQTTQSIRAICVDNQSTRIDKPEPPTGLTEGKEYVVHMYNVNEHINKPPMIRITNDLGQRASYVASRFNLIVG